MNPADLRFRNGVACITVDERQKQITVIVPEGYEVLVITPDSGQELTTRTRPIGDRVYPSACILGVVRREPAPRIVPAAAGEKG